MSTRTIQARIPAGVGDGQRIKLKGKGAPGERGGPAGDLYVRVHVDPHPVFGRSGHNLTVTVPVTFPEAALGAEIKVPSHRGMPVSLRIPAGHAERAHVPGPRQGRPAPGRHHRRPAGDRERAGAQGPSSGEAREALETFREAHRPARIPRDDLLRQAKAGERVAAVIADHRRSTNGRTSK